MTHSTGALTQKAGLGACITEVGANEGCTDGVALGGADSLAVTPDGRNVYVGTIGSDSVVVLDRDPSTGVLTQKAGVAGCVSLTGTDGACTQGVALDKAFRVAVSPDGRNVYVTGQSSDAVVVFDRDVASGVFDAEGRHSRLRQRDRQPPAPAPTVLASTPPRAWW